MKPPDYEPGQVVRVAHIARVVAPVENNPFWLVVEYESGQRETVSVARLMPINDKAKVTIDHDGSIYIHTNRLSPAGAIDLLRGLQAQLPIYEDLQAHGAPLVEAPVTQANDGA
jgi:hypothetical protein